MKTIIERVLPGVKYKEIWPIQAYLKDESGDTHFCEIMRWGKDWACYVSNRGKGIQIEL